MFVTRVAEYAHLENFGGVARDVRDYVLLGAEFTYRKWALALVAAPRRVQAPDAKTRWDHQLSTTLSYALAPRLVVSAGYNQLRDGPAVTNVVGTAVNYTLRF